MITTNLPKAVVAKLQSFGVTDTEINKLHGMGGGSVIYTMEDNSRLHGTYHWSRSMLFDAFYETNGYVADEPIIEFPNIIFPASPVIEDSTGVYFKCNFTQQITPVFGKLIGVVMIAVDMGDGLYKGLDFLSSVIKTFGDHPDIRSYSLLKNNLTYVWFELSSVDAIKFFKSVRLEKHCEPVKEIVNSDINLSVNDAITACVTFAILTHPGQSDAGDVTSLEVFNKICEALVSKDVVAPYIVSDNHYCKAVACFASYFSCPDEFTKHTNLIIPAYHWD